ncbi:regulator of nonsense transcripts 3B [Stigmatopora nigra]
MKEDKENTRPRERRVDIMCEDPERMEKSKEKKESMTKIVIRRLPPSLTKEELEEQLQPLPEVDYLEFFSNDTSLYPHLFARAYINFKNPEDIVLFRDRFDGYVFIDSKGQEYTAIVEFAPFQKTSKKRSKKKDAKCGTISDDPDYKKFLEYYTGDSEKMTSTPETLLEEIEARSKELIAKRNTPLLDFLKNKQRIREEKKEERRRRELERKRLRDEERRKWREEERRKRKGGEKMKKSESERDQVKDEPKIKLLKKPHRADDGDSDKMKEKLKKAERPSREDTRSSEHKRRQNNDNKEERIKRGDEEVRREFREHESDRDRERDLEKERLLREKDRLRRQERRRRREKHDAENYSRKWPEDEEASTKKEKERPMDRKRIEHLPESDKTEKTVKDSKKDDSAKRERLRNRDRPAIQLYQPGARSRIRPADADRKPDPEMKKLTDKGDN